MDLFVNTIRLVQLALLFLLFFFPKICTANIPLTQIDNYTETYQYYDFTLDAGLQHKTVYGIAFEKNMTVWVAASDGLYRYDGYHWQRFTQNDGLPSNFVRCVLVTSEDVLWVGTDWGAVRYDGTVFHSDGSENNLAGKSVRKIREDRDGSLWFCCDRWPDILDTGGLTRFHDGEWVSYTLETGLPNDRICDYFRDSQSRQFVLTNDGLLQYQNGQWLYPIQEQGIEQNTHFWDIEESPEFGIVTTTRDGFFLWKDNEWNFIPKTFFQLQNLNRKMQEIVFESQETFLTFTQIDEAGNYALLRWKDGEFSSVSNAKIHIGNKFTLDIQIAPDGSIWSCGINFLVRAVKTDPEWLTFTNFPPPEFIDNQNRIWFFDDEKMIRLSNNIWEDFASIDTEFFLDAERNTWAWNEISIIKYSDNNPMTFSSEDLGFHKILGHFSGGADTVWFYGVDELNKNRIGFFHQNPFPRFFIRINSSDK
jgi:hypothetical protein